VDDLAIIILARHGSMGAVAGTARLAEAIMDGLMVSLTAALATSNVRVSTSIANVYFRHPHLAASAAASLQQLSRGRFVLGLGTSHRMISEPRGIDMGPPIPTMRGYINIMRAHAGDATLPPICLVALRTGWSASPEKVVTG